jgi:hypothetical protein
MPSFFLIRFIMIQYFIIYHCFILLFIVFIKIANSKFIEFNFFLEIPCFLIL